MALCGPLFFPTHNLAFELGDSGRSSILTLGFYAEVQEREVVNRGEKIEGFKFEGDASSSRFLLRAGLRPARFLEIYGLVGGADLDIEDFNRFDARLSVASGGGVRLILFQSRFPRTMDVFFDAQYLRFVTKDRVETILDGTPTAQNEEIRWNEFGAKVGVQGRHLNFRPYGGLRVSFVRAEDILSISGELDIEEDDNIGVFGGLDLFLDPSEAVALYIEFTLFDVNSFRTGFKLEF